MDENYFANLFFFEKSILLILSCLLCFLLFRYKYTDISRLVLVNINVARLFFSRASRFCTIFLFEKVTFLYLEF